MIRWRRCLKRSLILRACQRIIELESSAQVWGSVSISKEAVMELCLALRLDLMWPRCSTCRRRRRQSLPHRKASRPCPCPRAGTSRPGPAASRRIESPWTLAMCLIRQSLIFEYVSISFLLCCGVGSRAGHPYPPWGRNETNVPVSHDGAGGVVDPFRLNVRQTFRRS